MRNPKINLFGKVCNMIYICQIVSRRQKGFDRLCKIISMSFLDVDLIPFSCSCGEDPARAAVQAFERLVDNAFSPIMKPGVLGKVKHDTTKLLRCCILSMKLRCGSRSLADDMFEGS